MPLPIAPKPTSKGAMRGFRRGYGCALVVLSLAALLGMSSSPVVMAMPQQAPNSRVVLDLPSAFTPSPLFSGFQDDAAGVSYVILEAPAGEYDKMAQGFTPEELAKRGILDVEKHALPRSDDHVYMRAVQKSEAGTYAKFFVLFRTSDQTVLVSVNVPKRALDDGTAKPAEIEHVLATAKTTEKAAVHELYALSYLGPFKEAGTLVGTSKVYTLDGRLDPDRQGDARSAFMVAPSLDKRPVTEPAKAAVGMLAALPGYKDLKPGQPRTVIVGGLDGVEVEAEATDEDDGKPIHLYQVMLMGKDGGYFRLIGIATPEDREQIATEFPKIAHSFTLVR